MPMLGGINLVVLFFSSLVVWLIVLITEIMQRARLIRGENARKAIHILAGFFIALMPTFASRKEIVIFSLMFFVAVLLFDGYLHRFSSMRDIRRWSLGQYLYPLAVILTAMLFANSVVFSFSILTLALADGFAAVIGHRFGRRHYHVLGADKTLLGSTVFCLVTLTIMIIYMQSYGITDSLSIILSVTGAFSLTVVEGSIGAGLDNLFIPPVMGLLLMSL
jgi:phytol kinase